MNKNKKGTEVVRALKSIMAPMAFQKEYGQIMDHLLIAANMQSLQMNGDLP